MKKNGPSERGERITGETQNFWCLSPCRRDLAVTKNTLLMSTLAPPRYIYKASGKVAECNAYPREPRPLILVARISAPLSVEPSQHLHFVFSVTLKCCTEQRHPRYSLSFLPAQINRGAFFISSAYMCNRKIMLSVRKRADAR